MKHFESIPNSSKIKKQDILQSDPTADRDARVIEVKVRLKPQDSAKVDGLTNLQVRITFDNEIPNENEK